MEFNIHYDIAAILISFVLIFYFSIKTKRSELRNGLFLALMITNTVTAASEVVGYIAQRNNWPVSTYYACSAVYFATHVMIIPLFLLYILADALDWGEVRGFFKVIMLAPAVFTELFALSSIFYKNVYYYNNAGEYTRNWGINVLYGVTAFYVLCIFVIIFQFKARYPFIRRLVFSLVLIVIMAAMGIQFVYSDNKLEAFAVVIGEMLIFYFVQNPHNQIDYETHLFNHITFKNVMTQNIAKRKYLDVIVVVITNFNDNNKLLVADDEHRVIMEISQFFKSIEDVEVYRFDKNVFCIEANLPTDEDVDDIVELIKERFCSSWSCDRFNVMCHEKMCHLRLPEDVDSLPKLLGIIKETSKDKSAKKLLTISDFDTDSLERRTMISDALARAIELDSFELVFSSIYSLRGKKIIAAECSSRFFDNELGYVSEREFIEYNDRSGLMVGLGCNLFEKVCKFIVENDIEDLGLSFISIKLEAESCLKYDLISNIKTVFDEYDIDPGLICFQISEYMVSKMGSEINNIMDGLASMGFKLCLNDYGSGYTNLASIYELPLDVIKLEKNVVRSANNNEKAQITLESTLDLARNLNMQTMIDGISEEDEFELLESFACDYAAGAFFYHDMEQEAFLENIRAHAPSEKGGLLV